MCWAYGIVILPVFLVAVVIRAAKKSHRNRKGICIVQKINKKGMSNMLVAPSLLSCDFARMGEEILRVHARIS